MPPSCCQLFLLSRSHWFSICTHAGNIPPNASIKVSYTPANAVRPVNSSMLILRSKYFYRLYSSTANTNTYLTTLLNHFLTNSNFTLTLTTLLKTHTLIITSGYSNNIFISSKLISLYSSHNKPHLSLHVFSSTLPKDTFLWNSIIKTHFSNGHYTQALHFFLQMLTSPSLPNHFTLPMIVSSASELAFYDLGRSLHGLCMKSGEKSMAVGSCFVYMYSKFGVMWDAVRVFDEMPVRDVVSWTALIVGFVCNDWDETGLRYFHKMHRIGDYEINVKPNFRTIESGLQACANLGDVVNGRCLHGYALRMGSGYCRFVQSSLLSMYTKCGVEEEAYLAFSELPEKDLITWTGIIGVYARSGAVSKCLGLFMEMLGSGVYPDGVVISCMLSCFGNAGKGYEGKAFHGVVIRRRYGFDKMVSNSLLSMYCKCGLMHLAEKVFDRLDECDAEAWNIMISDYGKGGFEVKCIEMFKEMQHLAVECDLSSIALVISSCVQIASLHLGQLLHCYVFKSGIDENISIINSLIGMYGTLGRLDTAHRIFDRAKRDIVTWNTMMCAYSRNELFSEVLSLFDQMLLKDLEPSSVTFVIVLSACSQLAALDHGKKVHAHIKDKGLEYDLSVATALVDMYVKCGQLQISREVFDSVLEKDVVLWNVMISGYGIHGDAKSAVQTFQQMEASHVRPNGLSFLAVLSACNHAGLVEDGKYLFDKMGDYSVVPTLKHYACLVDLLGRSGNLHDAEAMVQVMPIAPDGGMWGALLNACKIHNNFEIGERVAKRAIESDPENDGYYTILSNLYSSVGKWEEAEDVRLIMMNRGVRKRAGWSAS